MNNKIIDTQSESILLSQARKFKATDACALRINWQYRLLVWTPNIIIFIVIILGVNGALAELTSISNVD